MLRVAVSGREKVSEEVGVAVEIKDRDMVARIVAESDDVIDTLPDRVRGNCRDADSDEVGSEAVGDAVRLPRERVAVSEWLGVTRELGVRLSGRDVEWDGFRDTVVEAEVVVVNDKRAVGVGGGRRELVTLAVSDADVDREADLVALGAKVIVIELVRRERVRRAL